MPPQNQLSHCTVYCQTQCQIASLHCLVFCLVLLVRVWCYGPVLPATVAVADPEILERG